MTSALATIRDTPGLDLYLEELEERLEETVGSHGGIVAAASRDALNAGGKRLRPLLVFVSAPAGRAPSVAAGVAVEPVVHDHELDAHRDGEHTRNDLADCLPLVVHGHDHREEGRLHGRPRPVTAPTWLGRFVHTCRL